MARLATANSGRAMRVSRECPLAMRCEKAIAKGPPFPWCPPSALRGTTRGLAPRATGNQGLPGTTRYRHHKMQTESSHKGCSPLHPNDPSRRLTCREDGPETEIGSRRRNRTAEKTELLRRPNCREDRSRLTQSALIWSSRLPPTSARGCFPPRCVGR